MDGCQEEAWILRSSSGRIKEPRSVLEDSSVDNELAQSSMKLQAKISSTPVKSQKCDPVTTLLEGAETGGTQVQHWPARLLKMVSSVLSEKNLSQKILWLSRKSTSLESQVQLLETTKEDAVACAYNPGILAVRREPDTGQLLKCSQAIKEAWCRYHGKSYEKDIRSARQKARANSRNVFSDLHTCTTGPNRGRNPTSGIHTCLHWQARPHTHMHTQAYTTCICPKPQR